MSCEQQEGIYTSEKNGSDETGDGTEAKPFKTILRAILNAGDKPTPVIFVDGLESDTYVPATQTQLQNIAKSFAEDQSKSEDNDNDKDEQDIKRSKLEDKVETMKKIVEETMKQVQEEIKKKVEEETRVEVEEETKVEVVEETRVEVEEETRVEVEEETRVEVEEPEAGTSKKVDDEESRLKRLEESKKITLTLDESLPKAKTIKIIDAKNHRGCRLKIYGWVHNVRRQGKNLMFIMLRDGTGFLRCVLNDVLCQTYNGILLSNEASVMLIGFITEIPKGKALQAPGGHEMHVDYWELVAFSQPGGVDFMMNETQPDIQADNRHLMIRGERTSKILKMRSFLTQAIRQHYFSREYTEVTPPTIVLTHVEEGLNLFKLDFFGEKAHLSQTSQLYLETCLPALGDVFCFGKCFILENSMMNSYLSENTLLEVECPFIELGELMYRIEDLMCDVVDRVLKTPYGQIIHEMNPHLIAPIKPFMRMNYTDVLIYLNDHNINKDDGHPYEYGDDIPEMIKRLMVDKINKPILLIRCPGSIKPFYMSRCKENEDLAESVDLLLPGGGEVATGSMRIWDSDELMKGYHRVGINPAPYYWYNDQRKYGSCPHGGFSLRLERLICWFFNCKHIRDSCLYPRYFNQCKP